MNGRFWVITEVDPVVLGLGSVNGLHVEGVTEDELDAFLLAEIGEPVPGEHALDGHDEIFAVGSDGSEEEVWSGLDVPVEEGLAGAVEDAEVHGLGV